MPTTDHYSVTIGHNFETAHRLSHPDAPTKCQSIHGHSWWVEVTIEGESLDEAQMLVEFGAFKRTWRGFLDGHVDHHLAVHERDPIAVAIEAVLPEARILRLPCDPTTEAFARWLCDRAEEALAEAGAPEGVRIGRVHVQETRVNAASYERRASSSS